MAPVNFRMAWLISRACSPTCVSPISPSNFGLGDQGGHRVHDDNIDGVGLDEHFGNLQSLLTVIRLAY